MLSVLAAAPNVTLRNVYNALCNKSPSYLMFHVVLHVYMTSSENFETERTEQVFRVLMDASEMCLYIREERGPVVANLWIQ